MHGRALKAPEVELHLGAMGGDVHLVWAPKNWPVGLQGYNLKRRAGDEVSWTHIGKTFRPTPEFMRQVQTPGASFADIRALLRNFAYARVQNFAHIDRFVSGRTGEMEYALFPVFRGIERPRPAARVIWTGRDTMDLDVGLLPDKSGWDGTEAYFGLDIDKFRRKVTRYYIAEVRGKESRYVNSGRRPDLAPFEWRAEAVTLFMKFVGAPDEVVAKMKASPAWPGMVAMAPTIAYDNSVLGDDRSVPVGIAAKVKANTLVMDGGASLGSMPFMRPTADKLGNTIPGAQRQVVEGQAHDVSSRVLAPILLKFFN